MRTIRVTFSNSAGELDSRSFTVPDEPHELHDVDAAQAANAAMDMIAEAGGLNVGDTISVVEVTP